MNMKAKKRYKIAEDALGKTWAIQPPSRMSGKQADPLTGSCLTYIFVRILFKFNFSDKF
jgi:hypothetical protein